MPDLDLIEDGDDILDIEIHDADSIKQFIRKHNITLEYVFRPELNTAAMTEKARRDPANILYGL